MSLRNKVILITGASRGIGKHIALRAARDGAKIAILAKTADPHPKLPGTIYTAAEEIEQAGGKALPIQCDIRDEDQVKNAIERTVREFGGLDIVINNASAIYLRNTEDTPVKRYDLMHQINARGTWMVSKMERGDANPDAVMMMTKRYGMSMCVLGMSEELRKYNIAVNALWPMTMIETAAMQAIGNQDSVPKRKPGIMADAAYWIITQTGCKYTGQFFLDELLLREIGETDFEKYNAIPGTRLEDLGADFFLDEDQVSRVLKMREEQKRRDAAEGRKSKL
ncbi:hypothetical protein EV182_001430 [Spiromyces aspiralis]|uniref:Uncharacterized protein n=1 Tax=Spiromyces aspiralis TaxID=68401 RepID=A0ACC1HJF9_9FUNG|nr:hypothetical protein EV182_001430 [Spiromyces aspiralis]